MNRSITAALPRIAGAVASLVVVALVCSGCLYAQIPAETEQPTSAPAGEGMGDLDAYYAQRLDWSRCSGTFECATLTAPLDWENPTDRSISLALIRQPATGPNRIGSLLTNPGGPGQSGIALVRDSPSYAVTADVAASFDLVGFDPRGVGESTSVHCFDAPEMDSFLYDIPAAPRGSDAWTAELLDSARVFGEACEANSDGILPYITTVNAARDLDLMRAVLGDEQLYYLGYSYGTFLGATYAGLYPERVGRLVLDGAIDPQVSGAEVSAQQAIGFERSLRSYLAWCVQQSDCPFRGTVDQALGDLSALLASLDAEPLRNADGRMLGADSLLLAVIVTLYAQESWPALSGALTETLQGRPAQAFRLADFYNGREDGVYLDNSTEAFTAYNCVDYPVTTPEEDAASNELIAREAPTVAPYWSGPDTCSVWPTPPTGTRAAITAEGAAPIVVVGTTGDPATPYQWAVSLAAQLASGVLVTHQGEGHTGYNKGDACVDAAVDAYLIDGTVPVDGACG